MQKREGRFLYEEQCNVTLAQYCFVVRYLEYSSSVMESTYVKVAQSHDENWSKGRRREKAFVQVFEAPFMDGDGASKCR